MIFGDINGDGKKDFIKVKFSYSQMNYYATPYLANSSGGFSQGSSVTLGDYPGVALGDINGDGMDDLVYMRTNAQINAHLSTGGGFSSSGASSFLLGNFDTLQLVDLNGDGKSDLVMSKSGWEIVYTSRSTGTGSFQPSVSYSVVNSISYSSWSSETKLADFNGDGDADLFISISYLKPSSIQGVYLMIWYGDGNGGFSSDDIVFNMELPDTYFSEFWLGKETICDANGDGLADVAYMVDGTIFGSPGIYLVVQLSKGTSTTGKSTLIESGEPSFADINDDGTDDLILLDSSGNNFFYKSNGDGTFASPIPAGGPTDTNTIMLADINGDGRSDMLKHNSTENSISYSLANGNNPGDKIESIKNPLGGQTDIDYGNSSGLPNNKIPFILHPVTAVYAYANINALPMETTYAYSDAYYKYADRDFRGFGTVIRTNPDGTTVTTTYEQNDDYIKGRPLLVEMKNPSGDLLNKITLTWENYGAGFFKFVKLTNKRTDIYGTTNVFTNEAYTYDNTHGGVLTTVKGGTGVVHPLDVVVMNYTYINANASGWVWRKASEAVGNYFYASRQTDYTYYPNGNLFKKTYVCDDCVADPEEEYYYDSYGNVDYYYDPEGNLTDYTYDSSTYTYVTDITYPQTGSVTHTVSMSYHPLFGKISQKIDENQHGTDYLYDAYGRVKEINYPYPDGGQVIYEYSDIFNPSAPTYPLYVKTSVLEDTGVYIDSYEYVDGYGRSIQMITPSANNKKTVINKVYDSMGRNYLTEGPYFHPNNSFQYTDFLPPSGTYPYVQTAYDYHGRPVTATTPAGSTVYSYNGLTTTITDPDNRVRTVTTDYLGRTRQVTDGSGGNSTYIYNAAGDLTSVTDANGQVTSINYYMTGLKKNMTDPVMGFWQYEYDANGNLKKQIDAKEQEIRFNYDALNRVTLKNYYNTSDPDVSYIYDQGTNGIGRLYSESNTNVTTTYNQYDAMGRVLKVTKNINGDNQNRETLFEYDKSGKTTKITYPGGYYVINDYYSNTNLLNTVTGYDGIVYATLSDYVPSGKIGKITNQNGVVTDYTYNAATTRLESILTQKGSNVYQNRTYGYTYAGSISSIYDGITYKTYTYGYDNAGRLDWEKTNGIISVDMTYDLAGNVDYKTMGANTIDPAYETGRKNVIDGVTFNGNYYDFEHDDNNGNMTLGYDFTNPSLIGQRRITYNADNMPTQIDYTPLGGSMLRTEIKYDGNGSRVKKTVGSDSIYYFGDHFEIKNSTPMIYIFAGNMRVAQRENGTVAYFHKDHLGSSTVMTDENGNKIGGMEYYPFGGQRNPGDTIPTHYRFTDQELDGNVGESNLYNYNARLYDPIIGRFISADPIVPHPFNPQALNRYSYCLNNPLIYTDPNGHYAGLYGPNDYNPWSSVDWWNGPPIPPLPDISLLTGPLPSLLDDIDLLGIDLLEKTAEYQSTSNQWVIDFLEDNPNLPGGEFYMMDMQYGTRVLITATQTHNKWIQTVQTSHAPTECPNIFVFVDPCYSDSIFYFEYNRYLRNKGIWVFHDTPYRNPGLYDNYISFKATVMEVTNFTDTYGKELTIHQAWTYGFTNDHGNLITFYGPATPEEVYEAILISWMRDDSVYFIR